MTKTGPTHYNKLYIEKYNQTWHQIIIFVISLFEIIFKNWYYLYIMRGDRPCKFGPNCNKLAQGTCTFYHPPSDMANMQSQQPRGSQGQGAGFQHHSYQGNYPQRQFNPNPNFSQGSFDRGNPRPGGYNPSYNPHMGPKGFK